MEMRVTALDDAFVTKPTALGEHALRFEGVLRMARSLCEQVDWEQVRAATASPPERASFTLTERLGVVPEHPVPAPPRVGVASSAGHEAG